MYFTHAPTKQHLICGLNEHDPCFLRTIIRLHARCGSVSERGRANTLSRSTTSTLESLPPSHISGSHHLAPLLHLYDVRGANQRTLIVTLDTLSLSSTSDQTPFCVGRWSQNCISHIHVTADRSTHGILQICLAVERAHIQDVCFLVRLSTRQRNVILPLTHYKPLALPSSRPVNHLVSFTRCDAHAGLRGQFVEPVIRLKHSAQHNKKSCFANTEKACI